MTKPLELNLVLSGNTAGVGFVADTIEQLAQNVKAMLLRDRPELVAFWSRERETMITLAAEAINPVDRPLWLISDGRNFRAPFLEGYERAVATFATLAANEGAHPWMDHFELSDMAAWNRLPPETHNRLISLAQVAHRNKIPPADFMLAFLFAYRVNSPIK